MTNGDGGRPAALGAIGNTPIVQLTKIVGPDSAEVWVKLEAANPTGSYKDRMALAMIEGAERWPPAARPDRRRVHRRLDGLLAGVRLRREGLPAADRHLRRLRRGEAPTMRAFGADVELIPSPDGITPGLIPAMLRAGGSRSSPRGRVPHRPVRQPRHARRLPA